jgi:hypothetical protein
VSRWHTGQLEGQGIPEKEEDLANGPADPVPVSRANGQKRDLFCFDFDYKF